MFMNIRSVYIAVIVISFSSMVNLSIRAQQNSYIDIVSIVDEIMKSEGRVPLDTIMFRYGMKVGNLGFTTDYKFYEAQKESAWYAAQVYPAKIDRCKVGKIMFTSNYDADAVVQSLLKRGYKYEEYHPVMTSASGWYSRDGIEVNFVLYPNGGLRYEVTFYMRYLSLLP